MAFRRFYSIWQVLLHGTILANVLRGPVILLERTKIYLGKSISPRVIMPMSTVISNLIKLGIQILVFVSFYIYFVFFTNKAGNSVPQPELIFMPLLIILMGFLGLGLGMIISSMTTKYRDLTFLVGFGIQLLMYASAVMYPIELIRQKVEDGVIPKFAGLFIEYNPMTTIIEMFRYMALGTGNFAIGQLIYIMVICIGIFLMGLIVFNRTEKTFIDTI